MSNRPQSEMALKQEALDVIRSIITDEFALYQACHAINRGIEKTLRGDGLPESTSLPLTLNRQHNSLIHNDDESHPSPGVSSILSPISLSSSDTSPEPFEALPKPVRTPTKASQKSRKANSNIISKLQHASTKLPNNKIDCASEEESDDCVVTRIGSVLEPSKTKQNAEISLSKVEGNDLTTVESSSPIQPNIQAQGKQKNGKRKNNQQQKR